MRGCLSLAVMVGSIEKSEYPVQGIQGELTSFGMLDVLGDMGTHASMCDQADAVCPHVPKGESMLRMQVRNMSL